MRGYLVLESGEVFSGQWWGGDKQAGEVVFNTSHSGYEEMATDPSYFSQILVLTAPMQGNYSVQNEVWESNQIHIKGFVCLEMQSSSRESKWKDRLLENHIPILSEVDTRKLVLRLREHGTPWGAILNASNEEEARQEAMKLIENKKQQFENHQGWDWTHLVSSKTSYELDGEKANGPKVAVIDFGVKSNIIRELKKRCRSLGVFPSRVTADEIRAWGPDGILLPNGPGDPQEVQVAVSTVQELLAWKPIMGICMGHQILCLALGAQTYKLKFGHRGSNHPIRDSLLNKVYMTSQNHGYAVEESTLPKEVQISHVNLNDNTVSGISLSEKKCFSVQFHPESHPGPRDAESLFDYFIGMLL